MYLSEFCICLIGKKKVEFRGPVEDRYIIICILLITCFSFSF